MTPKNRVSIRRSYNRGAKAWLVNNAFRTHDYSGYLNIQRNGGLTENSNVDGNSRFGFDFCVLFGYSVSPKTDMSHCGSKLSTDMNVRFQHQRYAGTNT